MKTLPVKHRLPDLTSCSIQNHSQKTFTKNQNALFCLLKYEKLIKVSVERNTPQINLVYLVTVLSVSVTIVIASGEFQGSICGAYAVLVFFVYLCTSLYRTLLVKGSPLSLFKLAIAK